MRGQFEEVIRKAQDEICAAVEAVDGCKFKEDAWVRPGGGGGISRVLQVRLQGCRGFLALFLACAWPAVGCRLASEARRRQRQGRQRRLPHLAAAAAPVSGHDGLLVAEGIKQPVQLGSRAQGDAAASFGSAWHCSAPWPAPRNTFMRQYPQLQQHTIGLSAGQQGVGEGRGDISMVNGDVLQQEAACVPVIQYPYSDALDCCRGATCGRRRG